MASVFYSLVLVLTATAQPKRAQLPITLGVGGGIVMGVGSSAFFDPYRQLTGLRSNDFDVPYSVTATALVTIGSLRIGGIVEYFQAQSLERGSPSGQSDLVLEENVQLRMNPVLLLFEWEPWHDQFRTYLSGGIGVAFAHFRWYENRWHSTQTQSQHLLRCDEHRVIPAFRGGVGTHLLFDSDVSAPFRGALVVELRYTYSPVRLVAFRSFVTAPTTEQWNDQYLVGGSALSLVLGVRFQIGFSQ